MTKKVTVSVRIDKELWKQVKLISIGREMKISDFVETSLIHAMKDIEN